MMEHPSKKWYAWIPIILLISTLFTLECVAVHHLFTTQFPGANDFYAPWAGTRALLREGRDPYSPEVTAEIQEVKGIDPSLREKGKGGFAYPLPVVFTFWTLVYLPYTWAQAIWIVTLQWITIATIAILLRLEHWAIGPSGLIGLLLGTLFFYPIARSIMLGQFTLHVTFFLAATLLAIRHHQDAWAGAALALTIIKPQMVIFIAPWIVLWAIIQRRWQLLGSLLGSGLVLMLGSLAIFPRWPISFLESVTRYSAVAGGRNPIAVLMSLIWSNESQFVRYGLSTILLIVMFIAWRRGWQDTDQEFIQATHWTIVVSLLVPFQTGTTNQVMLLIPLIAWLRAALKRWRPWIVLSGVSILHLALWTLFLVTIKGDWENPVMFLPLPLLSLGILIGIELSNSRWLRHSERPTSPGKTR
jgi:hypothetical protein